MTNRSPFGLPVGIVPGVLQPKIPRQGNNDFELGVAPQMKAPAAGSTASAESKPAVGSGSLVAAAPSESKVAKTMSGAFESLPQAKREQFEAAYIALFPGSDA